CGRYRYRALLCRARSDKTFDRKLEATHSAQQEESRRMFARAAHCDVTPRDRPVRLAGYASRQAPGSAVLDGIEIAALLLESADRRCLILSFDLMMVGAELADLIQSRLGRIGFQPCEVMMLASHTHCAPATDSACARLGIPDLQFVRDAADAVDQLV